jgi:hypothetical protein
MTHTGRFLLVVAVLALALATTCSAASYQVQIDLDPVTLTELHESQQAILLAQQAPPGCWSTVWAAVTSPFIHNYLSWNETRGISIYASVTTLAEGRQIFMGNWRNHVDLGFLYGFHDGLFDTRQPRDWLAQNELAVFNNDTGALAFGLAQDIQVNNRWTVMPPLFACEMIEDEYEVFPSSTSFYIFIGARTAPGTMTQNLKRVARSQMTLVTFNDSTDKVLLSWDRDSGRFIVGGL